MRRVKFAKLVKTGDQQEVFEELTQLVLYPNLK